MRAAFQVLVFPYCLVEGRLSYALFQRADTRTWQGVAGGGEGQESPAQAAVREFEEETGVRPLSLIALDSMNTIPVIEVASSFVWGDDVYVVPEYAFGASLETPELQLSNEHRNYRWVSYDAALGLLTWDSNRTALWELDTRLRRSMRIP